MAASPGPIGFAFDPNFTGNEQTLPIIGGPGGVVPDTRIGNVELPAPGNIKQDFIDRPAPMQIGPDTSQEIAPQTQEAQATSYDFSQHYMPGDQSIPSPTGMPWNVNFQEVNHNPFDPFSNQAQPKSGLYA